MRAELNFSMMIYALLTHEWRIFQWCGVIQTFVQFFKFAHSYWQ